MGEIRVSEGVYGLNRAFKLAGVNNMIVSLWQVPDKETSEFMETFYTNWLNKKMQIEDAFRETELLMINEKKYSPYQWGAFVLIGN